MKQHFLPQDLAATIVAVVLVVGIIGLAVQQLPVPAELSTSLGSAITWLFVRSAQQAERDHTSNGDHKT